MCLAALLVTGCDSRSERADEASARFAASFARGDYASARIAISEALAARDDVAALWINLARTEAALQQNERAFAAYQRALELDPDNLEALQNMAELQVMERDFRRAEQTAQQILRISPGDPRALLVRGYIQLARGDIADALATAERVLARFPGDDSALLLKARAFDRSERRAEAIQLLETSLRVTGPTQPKLAALREFYTVAEDWPGLRRTFQRLVELAPDDTALRFEFAQAAFAARDPAIGNEQAARILRTASTQAALLERVADLLIDNRGTLFSGAFMARLAQGASPAAQLALARVAIETGSPAIGSRIVQPLLAGPMSATRASAVALEALSLSNQGNMRAAYQMAGEVLAFDDTNMVALMVRARAGLALGRLDDALAAALLLERENPVRHRRLLAQVHTARGNDALARSLLAREEEGSSGD